MPINTTRRSARQAAVGLACLSLCACAPKEETPAEPAASAPVPFMIVAPLDELVFEGIRGGAAEMAVVWGDPEVGPSSVYLKIPANFPMAMHAHSSSYHAIVIQGTTKHWDKDESEEEARLLKPGDFFYQGAIRPHQDSYPSEQNVVVFLHFEGPIDFLEFPLERGRTPFSQ